MLIAIMFVAAVWSAPGQTVQLGVVTDATTGTPIGGASVRIQGTTKGTFTRSNGTFRLPLLENEQGLLVRSIGYQEQTIAAAPSQNLSIALQPIGIAKQSVLVTAEIEPAEVVRRAIAHAEENDKRLQSMISTTYSKMRVYIDAPAMGAAPAPKESITETFATVYYRRYPERHKRVHILQRRQTRNIAAAQNMAVFDDFVDITQPEIQIMSTRLVTPLGRDALDTYTYTITNRKMLGSHLVYELAFEPISRLFPGFEGTVSIVDGTYQVVAADFKPTDETAFSFVKGLRYVQRYDQATDSVWVPMYQHITGDGAVTLLAGIADIALKLSIEAYVTEVQPNVNIADSLLYPQKDSAANAITTATSSGGVQVRVEGASDEVTVAANADSSRPDYWKAHAYTEMSKEEEQAYHVADSIVVNTPAQPENGTPSIGLVTLGPLGISVLPVLTRSTITGFAFGGELELALRPVTVTAMAAWGQQGTTIGKVDLSFDVIKQRSLSLTVHGSTFSAFTTIQPARNVLGKENFLNLADLLYMEYTDYYRRDGWNAAIVATAGIVKSEAVFTMARHIDDRIIASPDRQSLRPHVGNYQTLNLNLSLNAPSQFAHLFGGDRVLWGTVNALVGRELSQDHLFSSVSASVNLRVPTFSTGYAPMQLLLNFTGASVLSATAPIQYQHSLLRRYPVLGTTADLATVQIDRYGGNSALTLHAEHNFSDLWWRAIGLPTFGNKRGLDLIVQYGAGITEQSTPVGVLWTSTPTPYMEAGFALARIPSFVSDLVYFRFDALWPVGGLANTGTFGWAVTLSSPL